LIPPLLWLAVVVLFPTGWARRQLVAAVQSRSGRRVQLDGLSVCLFGGIRLTNLEIGSPDDTNDPWLKTGDLRLDISLIQLLRGRIKPTRLEVNGVELRILRRGDGTVELADLLQPVPESPVTSHGHEANPPPPLVIQIRRSTVTVIDEPTQTRLYLQNVEGEGLCEGRRTTIDHLRGTLNGGPFRFGAQLDRTASDLSMEAQFRADDVVLDKGMRVLRYVVPVLAGASTSLKGQLHADLYVQGRGSTWNALWESLVGQGVISLNPVDLDGAPLVAELSKFAVLPSQRRVASIHSDFTVKDRRIATDHFTVNIGRVPITLSGWTDLDGRIDYQMRLESLSDHLPDKARRILGDLNLQAGSLTSLTLRGTLNQMTVQVNGIPVDGSLFHESALRREDRERLRVLGRQLRDRILR
jgi:AsmA protein